MKDKQGRTYANMSEVKPGDTITVDGYFTCLKPWSQHTVEHNDGLFVRCASGEHYLEGQLDYSGESADALVGVYPGVVAE